MNTITEIEDSIKSLEKKEIKELESSNNYVYLSNLNKKQKIAATSIYGNFLVIAGPGTGKTYTLVYRVLHMIKMGIPANEICMITFTRKAAKQLERRMDQLIPDIKLGFIGTIHSLAYNLVQMSYHDSYRMIDPEDDLMIIKLVLEENKLSLPKGTKIRTIKKIIDYSEVSLKPIEEAINYLNKESTINPEIVSKIAKEYSNYKKENGYINYSDAVEMARNIGKKGQLKYLLIDEYQDTDPLTISMIKNLNFPNVMAIGDDFQSIYAFRGVDNKIILNFDKDFENAKVIKLSTNYRSTSEIVDAENIITDSTDYGYKKQLTSEKGTSHLPITWFDSEEKMNESILKKIKSDNSSTAVIYRFNNQKNIIESLLLQNKINYSVYGGIKLLERKHIKDLCAILLTNKNKNDFISYMRSLTLLPGIGEVTAKRIIKENLYINNVDLKKLLQIIDTNYSDITKAINDIKDFYLSLDLMLAKSNYSLEEIQEDFYLILELAKNYSNINNFISDIILEGNRDKLSNKKENSKVILTTIHSAKGLEFDDVFYIYNHEFSYSIDKLEENRRLSYTAISRAKNRLYIYDSYGRKNIKDIILDFQKENSVVFNPNPIRVKEEEKINKSPITKNDVPYIDLTQIEKIEDFNSLLLDKSWTFHILKAKLLKKEEYKEVISFNAKTIKQIPIFYFFKKIKKAYQDNNDIYLII